MPIAFGSTPITSVSRGANAIASAALARLGFPGQTASVFSAVSPPDAPTNVAITVEEDYAAPSQVTGLAVDSTGDGTIDLSWTAPASEAAITDYRVEYTPSGGSATEVLVGSAATSYQLTGLTNDTEYSVRVAAISAGGQGAYSAAVTGTPGAAAVLTLVSGQGITGSGTVADPFTHSNPSYTANHWEHVEFRQAIDFSISGDATLEGRAHFCQDDGDDNGIGHVEVNGVSVATLDICSFQNFTVSVSDGDTIRLRSGLPDPTVKLEYLRVVGT